MSTELRPRTARLQHLCDKYQIEAYRNWFTDLTIDLWEEYLLPRYATRHCDRYLELGVCESTSMSWVINELKPIDCVGIDPYLPPRKRMRAAYEEHRRLAHSNLARYMTAAGPPFVRLMIEDSRHGLARLTVENEPLFDLCYVDASHDAPDTITDLSMVFWLMKPGGVIVVDDLARIWNLARPLTWFAWEAFKHCFKGRIELLYETPRQGAVIKRA